MKISSLILRTADLDKSVAFWVDAVGLTLQARHGTFAFLEAGSIQLILNEVEVGLSDESLTELVLEVEDITVAFDEMGSRGVDFEVEPRVVTSDGSRDLYATHFHDPDGHLGSITAWSPA
jgi:catechol 2,3-dioxygenase-like lactoylglutathione lyase family enzyme